jgi:hypothetical protein
MESTWQRRAFMLLIVLVYLFMGLREGIRIAWDEFAYEWRRKP